MNLGHFVQALFHVLTGGQQAQPQQQAQHPNQPQASNQIPVGQPLTPQHIAKLSPQVQPLARIYSQNPMDPRVMHIDPAIFGYAPDNTVRPPMPQHQQWNPNMGGAPAGQNNYMNSPTHAPIPSFMGNMYAQHPDNSQFVGHGAPDPKIFGYPADNTVKPAQMYQNLFRGR